MEGQASSLLSVAEWGVLRPSFLLVVLLAAGFLLSLSRYRLAGRILCGGAIGVLLAIAVLPSVRWAMASLEAPYETVRSYPPHVDGILCLGGAIAMSLSEANGEPDFTDDSARMISCVALASRFPEARLVFVGGAGSRGPGRLREADVARQYFQEMGLAPERILLEGESRNTRENAVFSRKLVQPAPGEVWLLVTSAYHMPRAAGAFREAGWDVVPWPVGFKSRRIGSDWGGSNLPGQLRLIDGAVHEWIGMMVYRLRGWVA
jgi:uncharacterized SAM-binding protein YcdF (DUF218 family)